MALAQAKGIKKPRSYNEYYKDTYNNVFYGKEQTPLIVAFRTLLNGPFIPYKTDIPCVEALRAYINIIKCQCVYKQFNFADIPLIDSRTKKIGDPFIVNILKWSPSRSISYRIQKRERDLRRQKVYKETASKLIKKALYQVYLGSKPQLKEYDLFSNYLDPFKIVVGKFNLSRQLDESILHINNERILNKLERNKLNHPLTKEEIENIAKSKTFYKK